MPGEAKVNLGSEAPARGRTPPVRPNQQECCKQGCEPCIFDYYEIALKRWLAENQNTGPDMIAG
jgi:hypothetical protein